MNQDFQPLKRIQTKERNRLLSWCSHIVFVCSGLERTEKHTCPYYNKISPNFWFCITWEIFPTLHSSIPKILLIYGLGFFIGNKSKCYSTKVFILLGGEKGEGEWASLLCRKYSYWEVWFERRLKSTWPVSVYALLKPAPIECKFQNSKSLICLVHGQISSST